MIVTLNEKELEANPIAVDEWDHLGAFLKARMLNELNVIEDRKMRSERFDEIQNRDYGVNDVLVSKRRDVLLEMLFLVFKNNKGITKQNVGDLTKDEQFIDVWRSIMKESGIEFLEKEEKENPTENSQAEGG